MNNMVVVDGKRRFIFVGSGFPGSMHDARIFRRSSLLQWMRNGVVLQEPAGVFEGQ